MRGGTGAGAADGPARPGRPAGGRLGRRRLRPGQAAAGAPPAELAQGPRSLFLALIRRRRPCAGDGRQADLVGRQGDAADPRRRRRLRRAGRADGGRLHPLARAGPSGKPDRGGRAVARSGGAGRGPSRPRGRCGPVEIQSEGRGSPGALADRQAHPAGRGPGRERPLDHDGLRTGPSHQLRSGEGGAGGSSQRLPDLSQPPGRDCGQPARPAGPCGDGGGRRLGRRSGHRGLSERLRPIGDPDLPDRIRGPDARQAGQRLWPSLLCRMGPDRRPPDV
uniref:LigA n=1 Tax=Parastrongyloides trichosuri TaxID=131310 RepID=A0A0N5A622_PARTI